MEMQKITVRFPDEEILALTSSAVELGIVDHNGKPKISTFIKVALYSNQLYKNKLTNIKQLIKEKEDE